MICTLFYINKNRIITLFAQLTLPIKYVYHILKGLLELCTIIFVVIVWNQQILIFCVFLIISYSACFPQTKRKYNFIITHN